MNTVRIILAAFCCVFGTAAGFAAMKVSWILSLMCGPLQHLSLALSMLDNSDKYIDGVSRTTKSDYLLASLHFALWLVGVGVVFYWFRSKSNPTTVILVIGWVIVGLINAYFFAIRSV
jgi:hypothetical protein